jgi:hypothetical protein
MFPPLNLKLQSILSVDCDQQDSFDDGARKDVV